MGADGIDKAENDQENGISERRPDTDNTRNSLDKNGFHEVSIHLPKKTGRETYTHTYT